MALGAPTPSALPALSSSKSHMGGQAEEGYSRQADWKAAFCHCALEFPHQDASGDRPPSTLPRGGGRENQSPGVASELGHSLGLAFPMSRARISWAALGEKHKITKIRGCWVQGMWGQGDRDKQRDPSTPPGVGRERPKRRGSSSSVYSTHGPHHGGEPLNPSQAPSPCNFSVVLTAPAWSGVSSGGSGSTLIAPAGPPPLAGWLSLPNLSPPHFSIFISVSISSSLSFPLSLPLSLCHLVYPFCLCFSLSRSLHLRFSLSFSPLFVCLSPYPTCLSLCLCLWASISPFDPTNFTT